VAVAMAVAKLTLPRRR